MSDESTAIRAAIRFVEDGDFSIGSWSNTISNSGKASQLLSSCRSALEYAQKSKLFKGLPKASWALSLKSFAENCPEEEKQAANDLESALNNWLKKNGIKVI